jgi:hypothetical protein
MSRQACIVLFSIISFGLLALTSVPAMARIGCTAGYAACVTSCGNGRLCRAHCEAQRRTCENQKARPSIGTRAAPK